MSVELPSCEQSIWSDWGGLADKYDFVVVVDDTNGSFANVDVLGIADIVITSPIKSFNGFADVINPVRLWSSLKVLIMA